VLVIDPWYAQAFRQAVIEAGDSLQDRLTEMAFDGNVTSAIFLLKGLKPEKFRDRIEQTNLVDIDFAKLSVQQQDFWIDAIIKRYVGDDPAAIAETRRQLGDTTVVVDAVSEVVETQSAH